jgi:hypothetical protein
MSLRCRRQLHLWVSDADHSYVMGKAEEIGVTAGALIRTLIRQCRRADAERTPIPQLPGPQRGPGAKTENSFRYQSGTRSPQST